jgi:hypothetical protein
LLAIQQHGKSAPQTQRGAQYMPLIRREDSSAIIDAGLHSAQKRGDRGRQHRSEVWREHLLERVMLRSANAGISAGDRCRLCASWFNVNNVPVSHPRLQALFRCCGIWMPNKPCLPAREHEWVQASVPPTVNPSIFRVG